MDNLRLTVLRFIKRLLTKLNVYKRNNIVLQVLYILYEEELQISTPNPAPPKNEK